MNTNKEDNPIDRRTAPRVYASFVEYCRVEKECAKKLQAFTENISTAGVCIFVNEEITKDSFLFISIYLLDGTSPIETKGKVAWVRPSTFLHIRDEKHFDVGIEFVEIDEEDRERLRRYAALHTNEIPPPKESD